MHYWIGKELVQLNPKKNKFDCFSDLATITNREAFDSYLSPCLFFRSAIKICREFGVAKKIFFEKNG